MSRLFVLDRHEDSSGISGEGIVAEIVEFTDGTAAMRWGGEHPATSVWPSVDEILAVHGHGGKTVAVPVEAKPATTALQRVVAVLEADAELRRYASLDWRADWQLGTGYYRLQVHGRDNWLTWITALHGSPDGAYAAVRVERMSRDVPFEWHWMTPDGDVQVVYLEHAEAATEDDDQAYVDEVDACGRIEVPE